MPLSDDCIIGKITGHEALTGLDSTSLEQHLSIGAEWSHDSVGG